MNPDLTPDPTPGLSSALPAPGAQPSQAPASPPRPRVLWLALGLLGAAGLISFILSMWVELPLMVAQSTEHLGATQGKAFATSGLMLSGLRDSAVFNHMVLFALLAANWAGLSWRRFGARGALAVALACGLLQMVLPLIALALSAPGWLAVRGGLCLVMLLGWALLYHGDVSRWLAQRREA